MASERKLTVFHFEDEPWDLTYIITDLREVILDASGQCDIFIAPANSYPNTSTLSWLNEEQKYKIEYWFIESIDQLEDCLPAKAALAEATIFIIDVIRPDGNLPGRSVWRETLYAIRNYVNDVGKQVRLYTAFDVDDADEGELAKMDRHLISLERPPIIAKGSQDIVDFIFSQMDEVEA